MAYYREDEVARLIEQWMRWPGHHGGASGSSPLAWLDAYIPKKLGGDYSSSIPILAGEAADTQTVLQQMQPDHRLALVAYYSPPYTLKSKLTAINRKRKSGYRISISTFRRAISEGHVRFMDGYQLLVARARLENVRNRGAVRGNIRGLDTPKVRASIGLDENTKTTDEQ